MATGVVCRAGLRKSVSSRLVLGGLLLVSGLACLPGVFMETGTGTPEAAGGRGGGNGGGGTGGGTGNPDAAAGSVPGSGGGSGQAPSTAVSFLPPAGPFRGSAVVSIGTAVLSPGDAIHYTLDGSLPSRSSPVYGGPITIGKTSVLRAFVARAGAVGDSSMAATVYVRLADDVTGFTSNLPIVLMHTHTAGALPLLGTERLLGSVSLFEPSAGKRASLLNLPTLAARAGLRIHGNSSRSFPQRSYNIELREAGSDDDLDRSVAGLPTDSDWVLVAPSFMDRALVRTSLGFQLSNEMGQYAPRVRPCEVFLTENDTPTGRTHYMGVYMLVERIKRGKARVPVERLEADAVKPPAISGGYIFRMDHGANDFVAGGQAYGFVYPDPEVMMDPGRQVQVQYLRGQMQDFVEALNGSGFKHPKTGVPYGQIIDVPSFIDNHLINILIKNVDAFRFSSYFHKDRDRPIKAGPLWDIDRSMGTPHDDSLREINPEQWAIGDAAHPLTHGIWGRLFADPAFKAAHARRFTELLAGPFSLPRINAHIDRFAAEVREAQARHVQRWPEMPPVMGAYDAEIKLLKDWLALRVAWLQKQLLPPAM